jgi:predicted ferric reductase
MRVQGKPHIRITYALGTRTWLCGNGHFYRGHWITTGIGVTPSAAFLDYKRQL